MVSRPMGMLWIVRVAPCAMAHSSTPPAKLVGPTHDGEAVMNGAPSLRGGGLGCGGSELCAGGPVGMEGDGAVGAGGVLVGAGPRAVG